MKESNPTIRFNIFPLLFFAAMLALVLPSCIKEKETKYAGTPHITGVRLVDPAKKDSTFTGALPGTLVVVQGKNLGGVLRVYFNEYPAGFNPNYNTEDHLIVAIPAGAPTEATNPDVTNQIRIVTTHGETTYQFSLLVLPPVISSVSNENAVEGAKITLTGLNFYLPQKIVFPGDIEVSSGFVVDAEARHITVTVPAGIQEAGPVKFVNKFGTAESDAVFNGGLQDVLDNGDEINNFSWGTEKTDNHSMFPGARGNYYRMNLSNVSAYNWNWWEWGRSINLNPVDWPLGSTEKLADYALKFEIFVKEPWKTGTILIRNEGSWKYTMRYAPWKNNADAGTGFKTDSWITVAIPLTEFRLKANNVDGSGASASTLADITGGDSSQKLELGIMLINDGPSQLNAFDVAVDNIRMVKIKK